MSGVNFLAIHIVIGSVAIKNANRFICWSELREIFKKEDVPLIT